ncbi:lytic polysaccharide monooxygenase [Serratia symbiotica]|uniref:lytic polysaccharide monooxygenase n=1 Tax=Serratia symbiotica TaxID=138074 RepID=UPI00132671B9|nr:lytic polysaccharide monooxygenase [Serratia symbiotica]MBF1994349.1 lytic polysaccharide monooxygenase [Serratia symbiotica]MBQ0954814.1 lytic polysaccharide monooxygenase [Serratia symbiotica]QTP14267.1 lytic polysaccharide monooxygenase [Serratia symbiotica]
MKLNKIAIAVVSLLVSGTALSHGYVMDPPARAYLCTKKAHDANFPALNSGCGNIQYEPQSLEAPQGFPREGVIDGQIASANRVRGGELDVQNMDRWAKTSISAGKTQFHWFFTAPHPTNKYEYFITKNNWNPNAPLTRASFESKPFCTIQRNGAVPGRGPSEVHTCDVPAREGYQEILAVWTVNDTSNAFYNVIDVEFAGNNAQPEPKPESKPEPKPESIPLPKPMPEGSAWDQNTDYSTPCTKVTYNGSTWLNGWWTRGDKPGTNGEWDVWRKLGSSNMHGGCK